MKEHEGSVENIEESPKKTEETVANEEGVMEKSSLNEDEAAESGRKSSESKEGSVQEESSESAGVLDEEALSQIENMNKHDAAILLIKKTYHIVDDTEKQLDACKLLLQEDLKSYEEAKEELKAGALNESESLLDELGYGKEEEESTHEDEVAFKPKEELPPFIVKNISSGKFSSFLLSLIAGVLIFSGLIFLAAEKVGITLDMSKVPSVDTAKQVLGWYATLFGAKPDMFLGGGFVVIVVLVVMGIIYSVRTSMRASSNLQFAKKQLEEAQEYAKVKGNCKEEMDRVDAHMNDAIKILKTYQVVLQEQNGKLKRILHIEGIKEEIPEYHEKSRFEMNETDTLVKAVKNFITTSMSEDGKLSGKSTLFLHSAKSKLQNFLDRCY